MERSGVGAEFGSGSVELRQMIWFLTKRPEWTERMGGRFLLTRRLAQVVGKILRLGLSLGRVVV